VQIDNNCFLNALRCIECIDLHKSAPSFAVHACHTKFVCDILSCGFSCQISAPIESFLQTKSFRRKSLALNLSGNNLTTHQIGVICHALSSRTTAIDMCKLDLNFNHNINDMCARRLFQCVGEKCPHLQSIDLSHANITDRACDVIYDFYKQYLMSSYFTMSSATSLHQIDLSFTRITENGLCILDRLFNELPKTIQYVHNRKSTANYACATPTRVKGFDNFMSAENKRKNEKEVFKSNKRFEILLKGCFFEPMSCQNYSSSTSTPKLQTHCCIIADIDEQNDFEYCCGQ